MTICLIGLGSNVGDRQRHLRTAIARLDAHAEVHVVAVSRFRETTAVGGMGATQPFLNGAVLLETSLDAVALHALLVATENESGRERGGRWGPRTLDLDLLLFGDLVIDRPELV